MPPVRTFTPLKPVKTERTHEENQERAYIAASRRSDRSLEARVESARRASEIHKRRTGRSLRVTEQDVINEEMYEEEDDDLPSQYRRLTTHMNSGSSDFNRRLTAYLSNHVAMRNALNQALSNSYTQFPNGTPWAQTMNSMQSPTGNQINLQQPSPEESPMVFPALYSTSAPFRQTPYPLPASRPLQSQSDQHQQSSSSTHSDSTGLSKGEPSHDPSALRPKSERRASEPLHLMTDTDSTKAEKDFGKSSSASPLAARSATSDVKTSTSTQQAHGLHLPTSNPQYPPTPLSFSNSLAFFDSDKPDHDSLGPLSTAMPLETQMFPGAGFDPNNPFGHRVWNDSKSQSHGHRYPSLQGMNQTLAPNTLEVNPNDMDFSGGSSINSSAPFSAPPFMYNFNDAFNDSLGKGGSPSEDDDMSAHFTSAHGDWENLIDESPWEDGSTT